MRNYSNSLLDPDESVILIIDEQPAMFFAAEGKRESVMNNVVGLAKTARSFNVPCILSTVESKKFSGELYSKIKSLYPKVTPIDRTSINAWEDNNFKRAVSETGKKKLIIAGLWTEACVTFPALSALEEGYQVYIVTDACAGVSKEAHDMAIIRMAQAGAVPVTWMQVLLEFQKDWSNQETYTKVMSIAKENGGVYGLMVEYAESMLKN